MTATLHPRDIELLAGARHWDPFAVLGPHEAGEGRTAIRAIYPLAASAWIVAEEDGKPPRTPMARIHPDGIFEAVFASGLAPSRYRIEVENVEGHRWRFDDPYAFGLVLSDFDIHLLSEGNHLETWKKLGSHRTTLGDAEGVAFAVWAPNAARVSVVGDFNHWDGRTHPMRIRGESGIWELFVPGLCEGEIYKYEIRARSTGEIFTKADPHGLRFEPPPRTGTVVCTLDGYRWRDAGWMEARAARDPLDGPMSVYEVHLASWKRADGNRYLSYAELADDLVPYAKGMGYTHLELLPVSEHPFDGSWGYQTLGYFAPTARFGEPHDFMAFVDRCHAEGIGVILDWVPAHFPKDAHGLARFDGTHLYEHADPKLGEHRDWGTLIFNYGRREVANFLLSNALFWLDRYHIDGLRVDAVASMLYLDYSRNPGEWTPNVHGGRENLEAIAFLRRMNELVHARHPGAVTIAEESTSWPMVSRPVWLGGLGFTFKWNMGWMHDTLDFMSREPVHRKHHFGQLTFSLLYAFNENFVLPFSHDEVVHLKRSMLGKMPGDDWQKFANLRLLYAYMYAHPGRKLNFMGGEFGQWEEWNHDHGLDWHLLAWEPHRGLQALVRDLNGLHRTVPALSELDFSHDGFEWIDFSDVDNSVASFLRRGRNREEVVVCVLNLTPVVRADYRVGLPSGGSWEELLNTDGSCYGGSGVGNFGAVASEPVPWNGRPCSVRLTLPPLGALFLRPAR